MLYRIFLLSLFLHGSLSAQVVTSIPAQATIDDSVVVIFDATKGDGGLAGYTGNLYAHTGVLTTASANPTEWKYVIGQWGVNSSQPQLTNIGANLWQLTIGDIRAFYGIPESVQVTDIAFVFRSADSQRTGRDTGGGDIFLKLFEQGLTTFFVHPDVPVLFGSPERSPFFVDPGDTVNVIATLAAIGVEIRSLDLFVDGAAVASTDADTVKFALAAAAYGPGLLRLTVVASDDSGPADSSSVAVMINGEVVDVQAPAGTVAGVNIENGTVTFSLFAPFKQFVYLIGDFNDWTVDPAYLMNRDYIREDSVHFWLSLDDLDPDTGYGFQYLIDGEVRIADPYSELVLTNEDQFIPESTFPDLKPYPQNKTSNNVSLAKINRAAYEWQVDNFQRPPKEELVIYELLVRDFIAAHNYSTLIDTLDYLQNLGINAIELMPVNEFEGNDSWGYNPSFYFAPDKYYGTPDDFRRFVDACHQRGIAVILDMVLQHSAGQSPLIQLYASGPFGPVTMQNPWYNVTAPHTDFNFFIDFDHESASTRAFVDRVNRYWLEEYKVDGYRFDFTRGFTNKPGSSGPRDESRIRILKRMADQIWQADSTAYVILEHLVDDNSEWKELAEYGMLLWGNMNIPYSQSAMGWLNDNNMSSDLAWGYYKNRGWGKPHLITYMESHDEPWLMYKNLSFGRSSPDGTYQVRDLKTALDRMKLTSLFFLTLPGPKMLWQFGELGYDQELPQSGFERTARKPILWQYNENPDRRLLYGFYSELLKLRRENEVFRSPATNVSMRVGQGQYDRRLTLAHPSVNVVIIGNFDVVERMVDPSFFHGGRWYDYFGADTLDVPPGFEGVMLPPGGFRLYSDKFIGFAEGELVTAVEAEKRSIPAEFSLYQNYPNPFNPATSIRFDLPSAGKVRIEVFNMIGQKIRTLTDHNFNAGTHQIFWDGKEDEGDDASSGVYLIHVQAGNQFRVKKLIKLK